MAPAAAAFVKTELGHVDMDFMVTTPLLNDGKPQHYFDHPAYMSNTPSSAADRKRSANGAIGDAAAQVPGAGPAVITAS
jgi:hypothetical protein